MSGIRYYPQMDLSGGVQNATSFLMRRQNELGNVRNGIFGEELGSVVRRKGSEVVGSAFGAGGQNVPTGGYIAKFTTGNKRFVAVNNAGSTATIIRVQNTGTGVWSTLTDAVNIPLNARIFFFLYLDELYITGYDPATGNPIPAYTVDRDLTVSATRNILNMPRPYFIQEFNGALYAGNVWVLQSLIQNMTSPNTPIGVADASTEFSANFPAWRAFDQGIGKNSKWVANTSTGWLRFDFGSGNTKIVTRYSMIAVPIDELLVTDRAPKTWTFEGSNDGTNWTVLDTQTNVSVWTHGERRTYDFLNTTAYRYYRINVSVNQGGSLLAIAALEMYAFTRYPDRAYKSSGPLGAITFVRGSQNFNIYTSATELSTLNLEVDSIRYLKPGMAIDIYKGGTDKKLYDFTISLVDKVNSTIAVSTPTLSFATTDVNTATEEITLSSTTLFQTGTPIVFPATSTPPAGLTAGTIYYAIRVDATKIKVATTEANAFAGTAINLTSQGTGTHTIALYVQLSDNDEIWLDGRKGLLTTFWNTDVPSVAVSDFINTRPGSDSSNAITALRKSSNRLFLFTKNSGQKYDGSNIVTFNNAVGCVAPNSLLNIDDDWLCWVDQVGRVWARNDSTGQQEYISRGLYRFLLKYFTQTQLAAASAVVNNNSYKLYLGTVNVGFGNENIRIVYSFDDNVWTIESMRKKALFQDNDDATGSVKPYYYSDDGSLYVDETGNNDAGEAIFFMVGCGRTNMGIHKTKKFVGAFIYSENAIGAAVKVSVDGKQTKTVGQITSEGGYVEFPSRGEDQLEKGSSAELFVSNSSEGEPEAVQGIIWAYTVEGENPRAA